MQSLKAMPWPRRVGTVRAFMSGAARTDEDASDGDAFRLCVRRSWPKRRPWEPMVQCAQSDSGGRLTGEREDFGMPKRDHVLFGGARGPLVCADAEGFYRLASLVRPRRVRFGETYKAELFRFYSPDLRFACGVHLWHHCLQLMFYCRHRDRFVPDRPVYPEELRHKSDEELALHHKDPVAWAAKYLADPARRAAYDGWRAAQDSFEWQGVIEPGWSTTLVTCKSAAGRAWMAMIVEAANRRWSLDTSVVTPAT